jgi:hypothetical protein
MNDAERDTAQIKAIAAMTSDEVEARLRQFGLRPLKQLPPEFEHLSTVGQLLSVTNAMVIDELQETQSVMTFAPDGDTELNNSRWGATAARRWQFRWLKNASGTPSFRRAAVLLALLLIVVGITFGVRAVVNRFNQPSLDGISFVNFQASEEMRLREETAPLLSSQCTEAFRKAGLQSPLEVATDEGVVIRPAADLYRYSATELGLANEQMRRAYMEGFSSGRAQSGTVPSIRSGVRLTTDGRPRIFIHNSAFDGESFWFGRVSLRDALIHEFIHVGGQPPTPGWLEFVQHDLAGFEHHDEIMGACR